MNYPLDDSSAVLWPFWASLLPLPLRQKDLELGAEMLGGERITMGETVFSFFPPTNPTGAQKPHFISDFEG